MAKGMSSSKDSYIDPQHAGQGARQIQATRLLFLHTPTTLHLYYHSYPRLRRRCLHSDQSFDLDRLIGEAVQLKFIAADLCVRGPESFSSASLTSVNEPMAVRSSLYCATSFVR
jgi:hypothetical protein